MSTTRTFFLALACAASANALAQIPGQNAPPPPTITVTQTATGLDATLGAETMRVSLCADGVVPIEVVLLRECGVAILICRKP